MPFSSLELNPRITKAVREAGYTEPTPIQTKAIPFVLKGRDVIGIAQTGTGKTAAFVLPILERLSAHGTASGRRKIRALVVAPTRELVVQIDENVRKYARHLHIRSANVYGGVGERPQIAALRAGTELIVATPGRLIDLMQQGHADFSELEVVVLDEADRMLDMGFLPAIRQIVRALPRTRQTLLFSASLSKEIEGISSEFLTTPEMVQIGRRANPAESVVQTVYEVPKSRKLDLLLHLLRDQTLDSVLVFSRTKHGADKIARRLVTSGITTATLHSNRSQSQRLQALRGFKSGTFRVLVATDIAARGIDVDGISHVINYDFPPQPEDYVHRIGRTGRAHAVGDAISFVSAEDQATLRALEKFISRGIPRTVAEGFDNVDRRESRDSRDVRDSKPRRDERWSAPSQRPGQQRPAGRPSAHRPASRPAAGAGHRSFSSRPASGSSSHTPAHAASSRPPAGPTSDANRRRSDSRGRRRP